MCEVWKTIDDYPEYEVSNCGNVRSIDRDYVDSWGRHYHKKGQNIKLSVQKDKTSYKQVMVSVVSKGKRYRLIVSRLVAKAFIPNPGNLPQVNHKDENSLNNFVDNLEWCTCKYNINYSDLVERRSKKTSKPIDVYDKNLNYLETLPSGVEVSKKYNISRGLISSCCNGKMQFAKEYHLEFHS